jgi:hypothetical protein
MTNFYYGSYVGGNYWINLDHVSYIISEKDRLILKMSDGCCVVIDGEDYDALKKILIAKTVNWF